MKYVLAHLREANVDSPNFGKPIVVNVPDSKVNAVNAIRIRAANFAQRIIDAD
jgi:hypothetical protein